MSPIKKTLLVILAALVLAGGGFAAGRYAAPDKVVVTEKIVRVETEKTVSVVDTDKILNALKSISQQKNVHTVRVTQKAPDGTTTTTVTSDDKTKTDTKAETQTKDKTIETKTVERLVYQDREVTKTVERNRPAWGFELQPGVNIAGALGHGDSYSLLPTSVPYLKNAVLGVSVERRLIGPLSTGVWLNSSGMAGVTIRLEL